MKNKNSSKFLSLVATILSIVAILTVSTASAVFFHQGDTPEELL